MDINYIAVFLAALSAFVLGYVWYSVVFAKPWQKLIGMHKEGGAARPPQMWKLLVGSAIIQICMALNLAAFLGRNADWTFGLFAGVAVGFGWVGLAFGLSYLFEGRPFKLWLINAGYNTVSFVLMGVILGAM